VLLADKVQWINSKLEAALNGSYQVDLAGLVGEAVRLLERAHPEDPGLVDGFRRAGRLARLAFLKGTPDARRKDYGQYFTPSVIAALACAGTMQRDAQSVIDPTCGDGVMLWAAADRFLHLRRATGRVTGIEIDPLLSGIARLPHPGSRSSVQPPDVIHGDAFQEVGSLGIQGESVHRHAYDAVVGNPPYIRYQSQANILARTSPGLVHQFITALPAMSASQIASTITRASLISHLLPEPPQGPEFARSAWSLLQNSHNAKLPDPLDDCWLNLVASYSGLSDLSVPTWLLSWLLARPGGMVGYVTTTSHQSRGYGRLLRYFMLRLLQPVLVLEQSGNNWFPGAQVPTSLMIFRARTRSEATEPLSDRQPSDSQITRIRFRAGPDAEWIRWTESTLAEETGNPLDSCDMGWAEGLLARMTEATDTDCSDIGRVERIPEQELVNELLDEEGGAANRTLRALEGLNDSPLASFDGLARQALLPRAFASAVRQYLVESTQLCFINESGVVVNQGLRTGCNGFFYVKEADDADLASVLSIQESQALRESLSAGGTFDASIQRLLARLKTAGAIVPTAEDSHDPSVVVRLSGLFSDRIAIIPFNNVRRVIRNQRSVDRLARGFGSTIHDFVLVTGNSARPSDIAALAEYPTSWLGAWSAAGMRPLSAAVTDYIDAAETVSVEGSGKASSIPALSAVAPNVRRPRLPRSENGTRQGSPLPPKWWYTLSIKERHTADIFVPRIVHGKAKGYLSPDRESTIIDANFSTINVNQAESNRYVLFAMLQSVWTEAWLEVNATAMGGGALKVEAVHLKRMVVPRLSTEATARLTVLGHALAQADEPGRALGITDSIDREVLRSVVTPGRAHDAVSSLRRLADESRAKRSRAQRPTPREYGSLEQPAESGCVRS